LPQNPENQFRILCNDHKILVALKRVGPSRFTQLHREVRSSQRTLAKHLKTLADGGMVEKLGRLYRVTELGLGSIGRLETQMEKLRQYQKIVSFDSQRLTDNKQQIRLGASGHLIGTLQEPKPATLQDAGGDKLAEKPDQTIPITSKPKDMTRDSEVKHEKRESIGGPKNWQSHGNRFFLYVSPELSRKDSFPFQPGTPLILEVKPDCLVIKADEYGKGRIPFVRSNSEAGWFKGVYGNANNFWTTTQAR